MDSLLNSVIKSGAGLTYLRVLFTFAFGFGSPSLSYRSVMLVS
jgi:hypothetical protein